MTFDVYQLEALNPPPTPVRNNKLVIVNNTYEDFFVSIPEAGVEYVALYRGQSLVFTLPTQYYEVYLNRHKRTGGYHAFLVLDSDKTVIATPSTGTSINLTIQ